MKIDAIIIDLDIMINNFFWDLACKLDIQATKIKTMVRSKNG